MVDDDEPEPKRAKVADSEVETSNTTSPGEPSNGDNSNSAADTTDSRINLVDKPSGKNTTIDNYRARNIVFLPADKVPLEDSWKKHLVNMAKHFHHEEILGDITATTSCLLTMQLASSTLQSFI